MEEYLLYFSQLKSEYEASKLYELVKHLESLLDRWEAEEG